MNAALIHLASIECWQRASLLSLTPNGWLILQAIAACTSTKGIRRKVPLRELNLSGGSFFRHITILLNMGLIHYALVRSGKPGPPSACLLTDKGRELMTPQPRRGGLPTASQEGNTL